MTHGMTDNIIRYTGLVQLLMFMSLQIQIAIADTLLTTVAGVAGCSLPPAVVVSVSIIRLPLVCIVYTN